MKKLLSLILTSVMLLSTAVPVRAENEPYKEFYVSVNGNDASDGSKNAPFKTIEAAQMAVQKINKDMNGDIVVNIQSGTYYLDSNLDFQTEDSGFNGHRVIYRGVGDTKPIISGGRHVTGFKKSEYEDIYVADFDSESAIMQISVNSSRRYVAKSATYLKGVPRPDKYNTEEWFKAHPNDYKDNLYGYYNPDTEYSCDGFYMSKNDIGNYENAEDMLYRIDTYWITTIIPFEKIEQDPDRSDVWRITMEPGLWNQYASALFNGGITGGNPKTAIPSGEHPFMLMNAFELLDEPGEFYYNKKTKKLYYMPMEGEDMQKAEVVVPELRKLMYFDGNDVDNKVENITFENLQFQDTKFDWSGGMRATQAPTNSFVEDKTSAVEGRRINNIEFSNNVFCNIGGTALDFSTASTNCKANGNVFYDIGETAIAIGNPANKSSNLAPAYPDNTGNYYTQSMDVPKEYKDAPIDLVLDYGTRIYPSHYLGGSGASTVDDSVRFQSVISSDDYISSGRGTSVHRTWLDGSYALESVRPEDGGVIECGIWRDDTSARYGEKPSMMFEFVRPYTLSEITVSFKSELIKEDENADFEVLASNDSSFAEGTYDVVYTQKGAAPREINTYTPDQSKKYKYVMIRKLTVSDLALSKIWIGTYDRKPYIKSQKASGIEIKNNVLQRIGVDKLAVGLLAYDISNTEIQHNYIENVSYSGICVGYSWSLVNQSSEYVDCSYNWIENCNHTGMDGAGIYVLGPQPGSSYHNNRILNNNIAERGLYTDNGTRWNTIEGNVIDGVVNVLSPYVKGMSKPGSVIDYKGGFGSSDGVVENPSGIAENWYRNNYAGSKLLASAGMDGQYVFELPNRAPIGQATDEISYDTLKNAGLESEYEYLKDLVPQGRTNLYSGLTNLHNNAIWEGSGLLEEKKTALLQELEALYTYGEFGEGMGMYPTEYKAKAQQLYSEINELGTEDKVEWAMKIKEGREFLLEAAGEIQQAQSVDEMLEYSEELLEFAQANVASQGATSNKYNQEAIDAFEKVISEQRVVVNTGFTSEDEYEVMKALEDACVDLENSRNYPVIKNLYVPDAAKIDIDEQTSTVTVYMYPSDNGLVIESIDVAVNDNCKVARTFEEDIDLSKTLFVPIYCKTNKEYRMWTVVGKYFEEETLKSVIGADDFVFSSAEKDVVKSGESSTTYPASKYAYMAAVNNGESETTVEFAPLTNKQKESSFNMILGANMAEDFQYHSKDSQYNRVEIEFTGREAKLYKVINGSRTLVQTVNSNIKWNEKNTLTYDITYFNDNTYFNVKLNGKNLFYKVNLSCSLGRYMGFYSPDRNIRVYN